MFSTDCSVKAVHPSHVLQKQSVVMLAGFQSSKKPAGKVVRAVLFCQLALKVVPPETSRMGKEESEVQPCQAYLKMVPLDVSSAGNEVRAVHPRQQSSKVVPLETSSKGKEVRLALEQFFHVAAKLVPREASIDGNEVRLGQLYHAHWKSILSEPVDEKVHAPNVVMSGIELQAALKFVPRDKFKAGKEVMPVLPHAVLKLTSSSAWVLNVQAPNDVMAASPLHAV